MVVSELGDRTWLMAAFLAMRHHRLTVFSGAVAAEALMTLLSAVLGWTTQIIPKSVTLHVSTTLFALFGLKMLKEGYEMTTDSSQEEYEEAQEEVKKKEKDLVQSDKRQLFMESFTLTFLSEWGDRSQFTTIILAAREDVTGVTVGGVVGHVICTGIAVIGGRLVAHSISVRTVTLIGGVVFLLFAISAFFINPDAVE